MDDFKLPAILLAAGLSSRMGAFKPLLRLGDATLLEHGVRALQESGGIREIIVVVGHRADEIRRAVAGQEGLRVVTNGRYAEVEMLSSVQAGVAALPGGVAGFVLAFADQPAVEPRTIGVLIDRFMEGSPPLVLPTFGGKRGHPVVISTKLVPEILATAAPHTLKAVTHHHLGEAVLVEVSDSSVLEDLDTPEDFLRAQRKYEGPAGR